MVKKFVGWLIVLIASGLGLFFTWGIVPLWGWIVITVFLYLNLGNCFGRFCLCIHKNETPKWLFDFLWPFDSDESFIQEFADEEYIIGMTLFGWLFKIVFSTVFLAGRLVLVGIYHGGGFLVRLFTSPSTLLCGCKKK